MLTRFSAYNPRIIPIPPLWDNSLKWACKRIVPNAEVLPFIALCGGRHYVLTDCREGAEMCIVFDTETVEETLSASVSIYGEQNLTTSEWINIYNIACNNNIALTSLLPCTFGGKRGQELVQILKTASSLPERILTYIDSKPPSWKTLGLMRFMNNTHISFIEGYITQTSPSVQQFRVFIETMADFRDKNFSEEYSKDYFSKITDRKTPLHKQIEEYIAVINNISAPISFSNKDNFETSSITISFSVNNPVEWEDALQKLNSSTDTIRKLYKLIPGCDK